MKRKSGRNGINGHANGANGANGVNSNGHITSHALVHGGAIQMLMQHLDAAKIEYDPKQLFDDQQYANGKHNELKMYRDLVAWEAEYRARGKSTAYGNPQEPMPIVTCCPNCKQQHIDAVDPATGIDWRRREHRRHKCVGLDGCGFEWTPALIDTVGVKSI